MKKKLCRWIFKKELDEAYTILNNNYQYEMSKLKIAMKQNEKRYGLVKQIFDSNPNAEIIGLDRNKNNEELIVVLIKNIIYLFGGRYQGSGSLPRMYFRILTKESGIFEERYIHIDDVLMVDNNIGNGTVAMNALIKYAKRINAIYIDGWLSSVDNDHADRRNHYYEKFGFVIKDSHIRLELNNV